MDLRDGPQDQKQTGPTIAEELVREVRTRLARQASVVITGQIKRDLGEEVPCYGVAVRAVHEIGLSILRRLRSTGLTAAMEFADPLWRSGNLEEGIIADQVVSAMARHIGGGDIDTFDQWIESLTNIVNTDAIAGHLVSKSLEAKPSSVRRLKEWARAENKWRRRAAAVSFVPLVREGRFLTDALSVAELLLNDHDRVVQDGVGIMLQEASRLQADRVAEFLRVWRRQASERTLSVAMEKLTPESRSWVLGSGEGGKL